MKKKVIGAVLALVAVAIMAGMLLWLRATAPAADSSTAASAAEAQYVLRTGDTGPAERVEISNSYGTFTVAQSEGVYTVSGLEGLPIDADMPARALELAGALPAKVDVGQGELGIYGLDKPQAEIEISYQNSTASLSIGAQAPGGEGYYASADGQTVYLLSLGDAEVFLSAPTAFLSTQVTGGNLEESALTGAVLMGRVRPVSIEIEEVLNSDDGETVYSTYTIVAPVLGNLTADGGVAMLESLFGLEAAYVVDLLENASQLTEYGLDDPYSVVEAYSPELGNFALLASEPGDDGSVYLMNYDLPLVYSIPADSLPWLDVQVMDIMERQILIPYIEQVSSLVVRVEETDYTFEISQKNGVLDVGYESQPMEDSENFRNFYAVLSGATYDGVAEEYFESDEDAEPRLSFTYHYSAEDRSPDQVRFYAVPSGEVYVMLNDNMAFLSSSTYVNKVIEDLVRLLSGQTVSP